MTNVTKLDNQILVELAKYFFDWSKILGEYRLNNWESLKPTVRHNIELLEWYLVDISSKLCIDGLEIIIDEAIDIATPLSVQTDRLKKIATSFDKVDNVINFATCLVSVGTTVFSGNYLSISDALIKLNSSYSQL